MALEVKHTNIALDKIYKELVQKLLLNLLMTTEQLKDRLCCLESDQVTFDHVILKLKNCVSLQNVLILAVISDRTA